MLVVRLLVTSCFESYGPPPRSTRTYPLYPYTTLVRSRRDSAPEGVTLPSLRSRGARHRASRAGAGQGTQLQQYQRRRRRARSGRRIPRGRSHLRHRQACQPVRSEEHTSELQSLMRISYAVFCLKKKNKQKKNHIITLTTTLNY